MYQASVRYEMPHRLPGTLYGYGPTPEAAVKDLQAEVAAMRRGKTVVTIVGKQRVGLHRPE